MDFWRPKTPDLRDWTLSATQEKTWQPQPFQATKPYELPKPWGEPMAETMEDRLRGWAIPQRREAPKPEQPISVPFWQRSLQVFAAPFEWVDENIIKPGLSLAGTAAGIVPEVNRMPGEDYWEWKKRSWEGWDAPGINIDVPWSDDPWRIDVRGVLELAPWLLIPGAGQVGGGVRAARGVAGILGKFGQAGRVLGTAIEYSPWGLVEKGIGAGFRVVGKAVRGVSTKTGERIVGKIPEPEPLTPVVAEFAKFLDELVLPARKAFKEKLPSLRGRQYTSTDEVWASARKGEITNLEASELASKVRAGGIKEEFAIPPWQREAWTKPVTPEVKPPTAIEIKNWRDMGLTPEDIIELKTMTPEVRALHTHQARLTGFRNVSDEAIDDYLQTALALARKINDTKATKSIEDAIKSHTKGELRDAVLESEKGLGYIHQSTGEALEHVAEMGRLAPVIRVIGDVLEFPKSVKPVTPEVPALSEFVFSGAGKDIPSNWFARGVDKPLDFAKARLVSKRGGTPIIRVYKISDIEEGLGTSIDELIEGGIGRITPSTEYSYTALGKIKPVAEIELSKGLKTQAQDIYTSLRTTLPKAVAANQKVDELLGVIAKSAENGLVKTDSAQALTELLLKGNLPQPHHIRDFARIYGEEFAKSISNLTKVSRSKWEKALDLLNVPRAVLGSGDLSGTFRQGLILVLTHPERVPRAFARQLKAFASEKMSLEMDDALRSHSLYQNAVGDGVEFTALRRGAQMAGKEEPFASNLAQALPFVRRSERAFTTFLNEMRMGTYEAAYGAMKAQGASAAEMKLMGNFINLASGRGTLPANLDKYAPILNTVLFSARYQMSTLQLPRQIGRMLLSKNPYMRKEAAKALITFVGGGSAIVGLLNATGRGKVEIDPRSGDFGKIAIGKTRLDIWRGYVQYARFAAQMLTGERKSAYGNMNKVERSEIASRFLQSKTSPAFGLMVDLLKGESYMGEPLFNETTGFIKTAKDRLLPLAMQDVMDAMEQSGVNAIWTAAPATLGIGVLTYVNDLVRVKQKIARDMGYDTWDEIDPKTQREIQNRNVELQTAYIDFDRQVMGTAWGDWRNAGTAIEDTFRENVEMASAQYRATGDGVQFREKISDTFTARRGGYAARDKDDRFEDIVKRLNIEDTAEAMVSLGPEQMAIKTYTDALFGDDMYDEFGDYRFDEANKRKEQLHQYLGDEMFQYVEEYRGLKYETLPAEYQELARAKEVMKPYWAIQDKVESLFGKFFAESNRGKALITKQRQQMRMTNPDINAAYIRFYQRK